MLDWLQFLKQFSSMCLSHTVASLTLMALTVASLTLMALTVASLTLMALTVASLTLMALFKNRDIRVGLATVYGMTH